ncbi:hypothetical protein ACMWP8_29165, partial [Escherichia coli]|uniref:hypothetical protein n=1 Tax=Escherichia coli TaxID=562 RepID=UPI0039E032B2
MAPAPELPTAGYQGSFFLRDHKDWFVLFPKGRLQVDSYFFLNRDGNGLKAGTVENSGADNRPKDT